MKEQLLKCAYSLICSDGQLSVLITHQETATRFDLANSDRLVRGREYTITLAARNSIGFSNESSSSVTYRRPSESGMLCNNYCVIIYGVVFKKSNVYVQCP